MHKTIFAFTLVFALLATSKAQVLSSESKGRTPELEHNGVSGKPALYASDYNWKQTPRSPELMSAGPNVITLSPCPRGLTITDQDIKAPKQYVYIAGTGRPEAVLVEGGNGRGGDASCAIKVTTANAHGAGYVLGSASGGIKEASEDALFQVEPYGFGYRRKQGGTIVVDGLGSSYKIYAPVYIEGSNQQVEFTGGVLDCYVNDEDCFVTGDGVNSTRYININVTGLRARPMVAANTGSMIFDQSNKSTFRNIGTVYSGEGTFGHYIKVCNDQAFTLDGLQQYDGSNLRNDKQFVGSAIYGPGPFSTCPAAGWVRNVDLTLNCHGNGIDWNSGNSLRITDSVIQGWSQFGIRGGLKRGGYANIEWENVYEESGRCPNPLGNVGSAGVIQQGGVFKQTGGIGPQGRMPQFANNGPTIYQYWIVMHHASYSDSLPLPLGYANTDGRTPITINWVPDARGGADRYKILRKTWDGNSDKIPPYGSGNFLVAEVAASSACASGLCTFVDTHTAATSYSVPGIFSDSLYYPVLDFWPGDLVLSAHSDTNNETFTATAHLDKLAGFTVAEVHPKMASVFVQDCNPATSGGGGNGPKGMIRVSCQHIQGSQNTHQYGGIVLPNKMGGDGGHETGLKGRINFLTMGTGPLDVVTWFDSNPEKTLANPWFRPSADADDAATGIYDSGGGILYDRAAAEIRSYIGKLPDRTPQESLTRGLKRFTVPVSTPKLQDITDTEVVKNLNADRLNGKHASDFAQLSAAQTFRETQTFQASGDAPGIVIKQASVQSPKADIFQVQDQLGNVRLSVSKDGALSAGSSKANITLGATGPPSSPCVTGSLYTRADGGVHSTLYVCENGAWAGK